MIKRVIVKKLNGKHDFDLTFHPDLNIITGKNGIGKTSLMKLIWAVVSGNLNILFEELSFDYIIVEGSTGSVSYTLNLQEKEIEFQFENLDHEIIRSEKFNIDSIKRLYLSYYSIFFPTFRRMEGGFTTHNESILFETLETVSNRLSYTRVHQDIKHQFIIALSTHDINNLLSRKYAEIAQKVNELDETKSKRILELAETVVIEEQTVLKEIKKVVQENEIKKQEILKPWTVLTETLQKIFETKSFKITDSLKIGDASKAIESNLLSSGEKQMLSFLAYNFAYDNTVFFIDEPELSLHADWQRQLFAILKRQKTTNQFIVATHSPMIYSKYPDKEIILEPTKSANS